MVAQKAALQKPCKTVSTTDYETVLLVWGYVEKHWVKEVNNTNERSYCFIALWKKSPDFRYL